ncbi:hypothetical protein QJQ45_015364 [Haematococcus lacustris]|nr:hypothetical protein QJQ45_015364 [Haematococcus lacustris]
MNFGVSGSSQQCKLVLGLTTAALTATTLLVPDVAHAIGTQKIAEWAASGLIFKDTVEVTAIDDPEVDGLTIYISDFKRSIVDKLAKDFFTEPSQASLSCGISGPVAFRKGSPDELGGIEGKEVFSEQKGLNLFKNKTLRVRRVYDPKRNSVVYVAYSTRLNSASATLDFSTTSMACGCGKEMSQLYQLLGREMQARQQVEELSRDLEDELLMWRDTAHSTDQQLQHLTLHKKQEDEHATRPFMMTGLPDPRAAPCNCSPAPPLRLPPPSSQQKSSPSQPPTPGTAAYALPDMAGTVTRPKASAASHDGDATPAAAGVPAGTVHPRSLLPEFSDTKTTCSAAQDASTPSSLRCKAPPHKPLYRSRSSSCCEPSDHNGWGMTAKVASLADLEAENMQLARLLVSKALELAELRETQDKAAHEMHAVLEVNTRLTETVDRLMGELAALKPTEPIVTGPSSSAVSSTGRGILKWAAPCMSARPSLTRQLTKTCSAAHPGAIRVSSILNSPQPCEEELDSSKPTRPKDWKPKPGQVQNRLFRSACSKRFEAPVRGLMWCPWLAQATPGNLGKWVDRDCNAALNLQRAGESKWCPLELCRWPHRGRHPAKGKEYPALGLKKLRDRAPKAQAQQPVAQ